MSSEKTNLIGLNKWVGSNLMCNSFNYVKPIDLFKFDDDEGESNE